MLWNMVQRIGSRGRDLSKAPLDAGTLDARVSVVRSVAVQGEGSIGDRASGEVNGEHVAEGVAVDDHAGLVLAEADVVLDLGEELAVEARLGDVRLDRNDARGRLRVAGTAADVDGI